MLGKPSNKVSDEEAGGTYRQIYTEVGGLQHEEKDIAAPRPLV